MSGGEPSSIKRDVSCAVRAPALQLRTEDFSCAALFLRRVSCPDFAQACSAQMMAESYENIAFLVPCLPLEGLSRAAKDETEVRL